MFIVGAKGAFAVRDDMTGKIEVVGQVKGQPLPRLRSYEKVIEDIEKWINSSGLQKPTAGFDASPRGSMPLPAAGLSRRVGDAARSYGPSRVLITPERRRRG